MSQCGKQNPQDVFPTGHSPTPIPGRPDDLPGSLPRGLVRTPQYPIPTLPRTGYTLSKNTAPGFPGPTRPSPELPAPTPTPPRTPRTTPGPPAGITPELCELPHPSPSFPSSPPKSSSPGTLQDPPRLPRIPRDPPGPPRTPSDRPRDPPGCPPEPTAKFYCAFAFGRKSCATFGLGAKNGLVHFFAAKKWTCPLFRGGHFVREWRPFSKSGPVHIFSGENMDKSTFSA